ncbi:MAG TPA: SPOR domain-containing protein [Thermosulfurimonas dismutans]|uniref:SPOR domain-containing protein n=1 Tax=Thermosulfurimonas dismutans TaxID=999894 RepID=A0A7C3CRQ6_9BACT|nr:SPOR domain-containing protein [Thermosulfurimonas dismutans]
MAKRFRFELGFLGLTFVFLLMVCLFLWMFILGVWFGQRMMGKGPSPVAEKTLKKVPEELPAEEVMPPPGLASTENQTRGETPPETVSQPEVSKEKVSPAPSKPEKAPQQEEKRPYYALQVASFRDPGEAQKYASYFRDRGYAARVVKVNLPRKGIWYRVYVGHFASRAEAEAAYRKLKASKWIKKAYIQKIHP